MEGYRLIHTALLILRGTTRAQQDYGPTAVSIALSVAHSTSISLLLRVRAVVWKRGALQPGGPPLRATTALHPRSSPPGIDIEGKGVWKTGNSFMPSYIHSFIPSLIKSFTHPVIR